MTGTSHDDRCAVLIISHSVLPRMRNVSDKSCRENQNPNFVFSNFFSENRAVYEIMWAKCGRTRHAADDNKIRRMRIAYPVTKVTKHIIRIWNTHRFPTVTIVTRTLPNVTLHVLCIYCLVGDTAISQRVDKTACCCLYWKNTKSNRHSATDLPCHLSVQPLPSTVAAVWSQVVTIHTNKDSTNSPLSCTHNAFICVLLSSQQTAIIYLHSTNRFTLQWIRCVLCEVRIELCT